jgi:hypothetical protein
LPELAVFADVAVAAALPFDDEDDEEDATAADI